MHFWHGGDQRNGGLPIRPMRHEHVTERRPTGSQTLADDEAVTRARYAERVNGVMETRQRKSAQEGAFSHSDVDWVSTSKHLFLRVARHMGLGETGLAMLRRNRIRTGRGSGRNREPVTVLLLG